MCKHEIVKIAEISCVSLVDWITRSNIIFPNYTAKEHTSLI